MKCKPCPLNTIRVNYMSEHTSQVQSTQCTCASGYTTTYDAGSTTTNSDGWNGTHLACRACAFPYSDSNV